MEFGRREVLFGLMGTLGATGQAAPREDGTMYGMIGKMITGFSSQVITTPIGGYGLAVAKTAG